MKSLRKVASVIAGGVLLGSALTGCVSAGLDASGLSGDFFFDSDYNPIAQVVVGEMSLGPDSVAAGNIAAVIGNLAYTTQVTELGAGADIQGRVVLGVAATGAVGRYDQAMHGSTFETSISGSSDVPMIAFDSSSGVRSTSEPSSFYEDNQGLNWSTYNDYDVYEKGEFVTYSLSCESQRTDAGVLKEATYNNIHCLFCETLCLEELENPEHTMSESIYVNYGSMRWYEDGLNSKSAEALTLKVPSRNLEYRVDTECIPMEKLTDGTDSIDFEWRGKMLLFGEEYYVKNIKGYDKVYLAKGKVLDDVTSEGYTSEYLGYKFKIDHLIYSAEFQVAGILLDVEKPDGTVVQTQISKLANGIVDDIEIGGVYAEESDAVATASILVYDTTTNVLLEDSKDIELGGEVKKYWKVSLTSVDASGTTDISEYNSVTTGKCLENVTVQYRHSAELNEGESLEFPANFIFKFVGYREDGDYREVACSGSGEGNIAIQKVADYAAVMSFTGDDGHRYTTRIDEGPFSTGDMFILNGGLYEYDDYEQDRQTSSNEMKVTLRNVLGGGKNTYVLSAYYGVDDYNVTTYAFEESAENDDRMLVEVDSEINDTDVFVGTIEGIVTGWVSGSISFGDTSLALDRTTFGTFTKFNDKGNTLTMEIVNENGTADKNQDGNMDDRLIVFYNEQGEYLIVDLYDRAYNTSAASTAKFKEGVVSTDHWNMTNGVFSGNITGKLDDEDDTMLILPDGGQKLSVDYGSNIQVDGFSVCHPMETVKATTFIGTTEEETLLEAVITKDDEGKEQTVGCCTYTVKEFGIDVSALTQSLSETVINPVEGGLVVSELTADQTMNLIVVGGPAVNAMSTVTADELAEATDRYIVRKDGSMVVVAGYDAADTVAAGNALISWLRENIHA